MAGRACARRRSSLACAPTPPTQAININPFESAFTTNDNGSIFTIGNNLLTCPASAPTCAGARAGTVTGANSSNNAYSMVNLDADSVADHVQLVGLRPLAAGRLDRLGPGCTGVPAAPATRGRSTRRTRSARCRSATRRPVVDHADVHHGDVAAEVRPHSGDNAYQQFRLVTDEVRAQGNGRYWGANVAAGQGNDRYAGWSLIVVYRNPTQPLRNLTVFDGFSDIAVNSSEVIPLSGFLTPPAGTVNARVNILAYEGDRGATGDSAFLNSTRLATSSSPGTNFFNGTNDLDGRNVRTRTPADDNMLGFDIMRLGVPDAIPNSARSATVTVSTTSERYYVGWFATQIDMFAPDFTTSRSRRPTSPGASRRCPVTTSSTR